MVFQDRKQRRQDAPLDLRRKGQQAGSERSNGDEADLAEGDHSRVADEDVQADDDRHVDERGLEVDLVAAGREGAEERDRGDEQRGHYDLGKPADDPHARSTVRARKGAKIPSGRTSRTRMTRPKTKESTYGLCVDESWLL